MKIWQHPYQLTPKNSLNAVTSQQNRFGLLLKIEWSLGLVGYSDVFPWTEFGDPSLEDLKQNLSEGDFSPPLLEKSLWRNLRDARARQQGRSLFQSLLIPQSHGLLPMGQESSYLEILRSMKHRIFKVKMSGNLDQDLETFTSLVGRLRKEEKLRLDFNGTLSKENFDHFFSQIEKWTSCLDLIEDPWGKENSQFQLGLNAKKASHLLARDFYPHFLWPHQVIKTSRRFLPTQRPLSGRVILTHSMDHPIGQAFALWEAAWYQRHYPHRSEIQGVARFTGYNSTEFDWIWNGAGACPEPPKGLGIGFGEILSHLSWELIR